MWRYNLHETYRHIPRVRASSSSGRPIDGPRRIADGNCPNSGRGAGLPVSVESPSTAPRRAERPSASGSSRAPESGPGSSVSRLAQERRYGVWVVQQPVDGGARNRNDSTPLRPVVSSRTCAQDRQTAFRLDQSANSSSSPRARRKKDRRVARSTQRADPKKKRNSKRPISSSKMNRALCLGPRVGAPSRPGGRHPSKRPGIGMTASRPSVCSRSVPTVTNPIFFFELLPDNKKVNGPYLVAFLRQLRRHLPGPILLVWDGSPIHRSKVVQRYLERHPNIYIEPLPAYAPELNPDEGVWSYTKYGRMANYAPKNTNALRQRLTSELTRLQKKPKLLRAFIRHTKLSLRL